jgi:hypothetical protein
VKDQRPGLCVVGMNFADTTQTKHSDTVRMNTLQSLCPSARVWGVSVHYHSPQQTRILETPTWVHADVRVSRFWSETGALSVRKTLLLIVDYRWCPPVYWEAYTSVGLGYGNKWFSHHLPDFFLYGGMFCFLPNTPNVREMQRAHPDARLFRVESLSVSECSWNPLFRATDVATEQDGGEPWRRTLGPLMISVCNQNALTALDPDYPFFLCYSRTLNDKKNALIALSIFLTGPLCT